MKTLLIYNEHNSKEVLEVNNLSINNIVVEKVKLSDCSDDLKCLVSITPCIITTQDNLQGNSILNESINFSDVVNAKLMSRLQEEESEFRNVDNQRLSEFVAEERKKAVEEYILQQGL